MRVGCMWEAELCILVQVWEKEEMCSTNYAKQITQKNVNKSQKEVNWRPT